MKKPMSVLAGDLREKLVKRFAARRETGEVTSAPSPSAASPDIDQFCRFDAFPAYRQIVSSLQSSQPALAPGQGEGDFASYDYLGLASDPRVREAAKQAVDQYGSSVSASRLVAGERPLLRELEAALAEIYAVDDALVFVSRYAGNETTIGHLFGPRDLVVHDQFCHLSVLEGVRLAGATRRAFPHNDLPALEKLLAGVRGDYERVLIVADGLSPVAGDICDLPGLVALKRRYRTFLMIDDAHALGVLGEGGRGSREHWALAGDDVDFWSGSLGHALAGAGGYIAGSRALIDLLKYSAPGFVYSVGLAPAMAAAAREALRILGSEPARPALLRQNARQFLAGVHAQGFATGACAGQAVIPLILGDSGTVLAFAEHLAGQGIQALPLVSPAVDECQARLVFCIHHGHGAESLERALAALGSARLRVGVKP